MEVEKIQLEYANPKRKEVFEYMNTWSKGYFIHRLMLLMTNDQWEKFVISATTKLE